jgi:hypothetical protein
MMAKAKQQNEDKDKNRQDIAEILLKVALNIITLAFTTLCPVSG